MDLFGAPRDNKSLLEEYMEQAEAGIFDGNEETPRGFFRKRISLTMGADPTRYHGIISSSGGESYLNTSKKSIIQAFNSEINQARNINLNEYAQIFFNLAHQKGLIEHQIGVSSERYRTRVSPMVKTSFNTAQELVEGTRGGRFPKSPMDLITRGISKYKKPTSYLAVLRQPLDVQEGSGEKFMRFLNSFESAVVKNDADGDENDVLKLKAFIHHKMQILGELMSKNPVLGDPRFTKRYQASFEDLFPMDSTEWWKDPSIQKDFLRDLKTYASNKSFKSNVDSLRARIRVSNVGKIVSATNSIEQWQMMQMSEQYPNMHPRDIMNLIAGSGHWTNKENDPGMGAGKKYLGEVQNYLEEYALKSSNKNLVRTKSNILNPDSFVIRGMNWRERQDFREGNFTGAQRAAVAKELQEGPSRKIRVKEILRNSTPVITKPRPTKKFLAQVSDLNLLRDEVEEGTFWDRYKYYKKEIATRTKWEGDLDSYNAFFGVHVFPADEENPPVLSGQSLDKKLLPWRSGSDRTVAARSLLKNLGIDYTEVAVSGDHAVWAEEQGIEPVGYILSRSMRIVQQAEEGGIKSELVKGLPLMGQLENRTVLNETLLSGATKMLHPMYQVEQGKLVQHIDPIDQLAHILEGNLIQPGANGDRAIKNARMFGEVPKETVNFLKSRLRSLDSDVMVSLRNNGVDPVVLQSFHERFLKLSQGSHPKGMMDNLLSEFQILRDTTFHAGKYLEIKDQIREFLDEYGSNVRAEYSFVGKGGLKGQYIAKVSDQNLDSLGRVAWLVQNTGGKMGFTQMEDLVQAFNVVSGHALMGTKPRDFFKGGKVTFGRPGFLDAHPNRVNQLQSQMLDSIHVQQNMVMVNMSFDSVRDLYKRTSRLDLPEFAEKNPGESIAIMSKYGRDQFRGAKDQFHMLPGVQDPSGTDLGVLYNSNGLDVVPVMGANTHLEKLMAEGKITFYNGDRITSTNVDRILGSDGTHYGLAITSGESMSKNTLTAWWLQALKSYGHEVPGLKDYSPESLSDFAKSLDTPEKWKDFVDNHVSKLAVDLDIDGQKAKGLKLGHHEAGLWVPGGPPGRTFNPIIRGTSSNVADATVFTAAQELMPNVSTRDIQKTMSEALDMSVNASGKTSAMGTALDDIGDYLAASTEKGGFIFPKFNSISYPSTAQLIDKDTGAKLASVELGAGEVPLKNKKLLKAMRSAAEAATEAMANFHLEFLRRR